MRDISFFSEDTYLSIPNRKNPKVILAFGNKKIVKNSFEIYNPFSTKAKLFKWVVRFFGIHFKSLVLKLFDVEKHQNSEFINFLNQEYQTKFTASIYNATLKDKVVIQLQSEGSIYGYAKFPLNERGLHNIKNEIYAIELLSKIEIINLEMKTFEFHKTPFFILPDLQGHFENISDNEIYQFVESFKKDKILKLKDHLRIIEIRDFLEAQNLIIELDILKSVLKTSKDYYNEVYEHGDFAPWNIVKTKNGMAAFDFEYFVENGLEYFDIIKYHFQVGRLLKGKNQNDLYQYVSDKIGISEIREMLSLFLLKEIMNSYQQNKASNFETKMLNFINA